MYGFCPNYKKNFNKDQFHLDVNIFVGVDPLQGLLISFYITTKT